MHICDPLVTGNLEDLIRHGLHALRETLQQDKELTHCNYLRIGVVHAGIILLSPL